MLDSITTSAGRKGIRYETATGDIVEDLGQKDFVAITDDTAMVRSMTAQVAEGVTKGLLSIIKSMEAGSRIVFDSEGSYIMDKQTGEWTSMYMKDGLMQITLWCRHPAADEAPF